MKLHENKQLFKNAIDYIVQTHHLSTEIVVKDYYVTLALKMVFSRFEDLVFIGGTSLSKCFNIINRFSEDIDIAAVGESRKGKQRKTENVLQYFVENWQYKVLHDNLRLASDFKPLFLEYPNEYPGILSNQVRLELLAFVDPFPTVVESIQSMVNEILTVTEIVDFDMQPFEIKIQEPYRTFVEKILLQKEIHKDFINGELSPETAQERARDFYDVHKIWEYYKGSPPIDLNDVKQFIDSRNISRKSKTSISEDEFNQFSLYDQFMNQQISKQLSKDKSKLSIRDLNDKAIASSLIQIDDYFKKMI